MTDFFFYLFAAVTLGCGLLVVGSRNPVNAAMFLILTFLGMASLFVLLEAYFLAVIQVLVYAGAVVVLFLFIIMLLDVKEAAQQPFKPLSVVAGCVGFALMVMSVVSIVNAESIRTVAESPEMAEASKLKTFGYELFSTYQLPMQVTGFLLLVAMIGVIVISKKVKTGEASA